MIRAYLAAAVVLALTPPCRAQDPDAITVEQLADRGDIKRFLIKTEHYEILYEDGDLPPREVGAALEAAYALRKTFFRGKEPPRSDLPLKVKAFKDVEGFTAALKADKVKGSTPGYYAPSTGTAYSANTNLALMVHEATHQFHFKAWGGKKSPTWFSEGVAEMFALLSWEDEKLEAGLSPSGWRKTFPSQVLRLLRNKQIAKNPSRLILANLTFRRKNDNYAFFWCWNRFLMEDDPKAYLRLMDAFQAGTPTQKAWTAAYGNASVTREQYDRFVKWLRQVPRSLKFKGWDDVPGNR